MLDCSLPLMVLQSHRSNMQAAQLSQMQRSRTGFLPCVICVVCLWAFAGTSVTFVQSVKWSWRRATASSTKATVVHAQGGRDGEASRKEVVHVDTRLKAAIMGPGGLRIRNWEQRSGARIQIEQRHFKRSQMDNVVKGTKLGKAVWTVEIYGTPEQCAMVREWIDGQKPRREVVNVSVRTAQAIIGDDLQHDVRKPLGGAVVYLGRRWPLPQLIVNGHPDKLETAQRLIREMEADVGKDQRTTVQQVVNITYQQRGLVAGRGGARIKALRQDTGASIAMLGHVAGVGTQIRISGPEDAVMDARRSIIQLIVDSKVKGKKSGTAVRSTPQDIQITSLVPHVFPVLELNDRTRIRRLADEIRVQFELRERVVEIVITDDDNHAGVEWRSFGKLLATLAWVSEKCRAAAQVVARRRDGKFRFRIFADMPLQEIEDVQVMTVKGHDKTAEVAEAMRSRLLDRQEKVARLTSLKIEMDDEEACAKAVQALESLYWSTRREVTFTAEMQERRGDSDKADGRDGFSNERRPWLTLVTTVVLS
mmetsp:Transcript_34820/g.81301  ORF Transcript_34820/g.81301 Transcript_34820/m.81301 type:complete len:535 (+) Transcript_34820:46-1650(+)